jgi:hypothetical protein
MPFNQGFHRQMLHNFQKYCKLRCLNVWQCDNTFVIYISRNRNLYSTSPTAIGIANVYVPAGVD